MITKELNGGGRIVLAGAILRMDRYTSHLYEVLAFDIHVPHLDEILAFSFPTIGPDYFKNVMSAIDQDKGLMPTTRQTFSLVDLVLQNSDEEHCKGILGKFRNHCFWTATENLWGKEDVIVYDNVDGTMPSDRASLIKRHKDGDKAVRVVPYGFKTWKQSISKLVENPYVIAQVGDKDFAEDVVARVAKGLRNKGLRKNKPLIETLNPTKEDEKKYTVLGPGWVTDDWFTGGVANRLGLRLYGTMDDYAYCFCASRVRVVSAEGASPKK